MDMEDREKLYRLERLGPELVEMVATRQMPFTFERTELLARMVALLPSINVLLIGDEGVGKYSLVRSLAYRIHHLKNRKGETGEEASWIYELFEDDVQHRSSKEPPSDDQMLFPYNCIFKTDPFALAQDIFYAGDLGNKMKCLTEQALEEKAILFVRDIHNAVGTGSATNSPLYDVAHTLASAMERKNVRVIGATTTVGQKILLRRAPALLNKFEVVKVPPVDFAEMNIWFQRWQDHLRSRGPLRFHPTFLPALLQVCQQFYPGYACPGKVFSLADKIMARKLSATATQAVRGEQEKKAAPEKSIMLEDRDVQGYILEETGVPAEIIENRPLPADQLEAMLVYFFTQYLIGQPQAVRKAIEVIIRYKARLTLADKPLAVMLLWGPTGVGKTEFAKTLARFFFGSKRRLIRYDMSEFMDPASLKRLTGSQLGKLDDASMEHPSLVEEVRNNPFSVVLFDEIEKAESRILDIFLQVFDEAKLTDASGNVAHFSNTIILLTTNMAAELFDTGMGFNASEHNQPTELEVRKHLENHLRPELVNRIEYIVPFYQLDRRAIRQVLAKEIYGLRKRASLREGEFDLWIEDALVEKVLAEGYVPRYGARPLNRAVAEYILMPLAFMVSAGVSPKGKKICITAAPRPQASLVDTEPGAGFSHYHIG
jgi:ATP-dependent Clp protease ATP-binding subunit ClpC